MTHLKLFFGSYPRQQLIQKVDNKKVGRTVATFQTMCATGSSQHKKPHYERSESLGLSLVCNRCVVCMVETCKKVYNECLQVYHCGSDYEQIMELLALTSNLFLHVFTPVSNLSIQSVPTSQLL